MVDFDLVGFILTKVKTLDDRRCINPNSMEAQMSNRIVKHEIKLPKYLIVLLAMLVIGLFANAFAPVLSIKDAYASGYAWTKGISDSIDDLTIAVVDIDCKR